MEGIEELREGRRRVESHGLAGVKRPQESEASERQGTRRRPEAWGVGGSERR